MSWEEHHTESEQFANLADIARKRGDIDESELYLQAAECEHRALLALDLSKMRTIGITAISAIVLYCKANKFGKAKMLTCKMLNGDLSLPAFAEDHMRMLMQAIRDSEYGESVRAKVKQQFGIETIWAKLARIGSGQEARTKRQ